MRRILLIVAIASVFTSCGNGSESSTSSDSTTNSITPPSPSDTTSEMAPMMGDTSEIEVDSVKK